MKTNPTLAVWMISRRHEIELSMNEALGPAAPSAGADESEVLRRFRTFAAATLQNGDSPAPALDGLKMNERRVEALLGAWVEACSRLAGNEGRSVRAALKPLLEQFRRALRSSTTRRTKSGTPRARRRAVAAAIDRVYDSFLAVDTVSGSILDANPAAGALLGVERNALLGIDVMSFIPGEEQPHWWTHIDAMTEDSDVRLFETSLKDRSGDVIAVECSMTRFESRGRVLGLIVARAAQKKAVPVVA
ncbi:PAS domain-containing protein [Myxococcota bacterium]|nr:PAS domain-containing protein [Myxococcota bacterium]